MNKMYENQNIEFSGGLFVLFSHTQSTYFVVLEFDEIILRYLNRLRKIIMIPKIFVIMN